MDNLTDCSEAAKLKDIFKSPFTDIPETHADCGYIAIAKAMGFASDSDGNLAIIHIK